MDESEIVERLDAMEFEYADPEEYPTFMNMRLYRQNLEPGTWKMFFRHFGHPDRGAYAVQVVLFYDDDDMIRALEVAGWLKYVDLQAMIAEDLVDGLYSSMADDTLNTFTHLTQIPESLKTTLARTPEEGSDVDWGRNWTLRRVYNNDDQSPFPNKRLIYWLDRKE